MLYNIFKSINCIPHPSLIGQLFHFSPHSPVHSAFDMLTLNEKLYSVLTATNYTSVTTTYVTTITTDWFTIKKLIYRIFIVMTTLITVNAD